MPALKMSDRYDVFLSYSREDGDLVERLARRLRDAGYESWFDRDSIPAGEDWVAHIDAGLRRSETCLMLLGAGRRRGWAEAEMSAVLNLAVGFGETRPAIRLIPVLLPGAPERDGEADRSEWPLVLRTREWVDLRGGIEDDDSFEDLLRALSPAASAVPAEMPCPYPGLEPFKEHDARRFFGRDDELEEIVRRLERGRFLAVTGASGSGKSSLVMAGVLPRLRKARRDGTPLQVVVARPRGDAWAWLRVTIEAGGIDSRHLDRLGRSTGALRDLAMTIAASADLVLVVDQFEELFTQPPEVRDGFIDELLALCSPDGPAQVVLTLRADFLGAAAEHPGLAAALSNSQFVLAPLSGHRLRAAVERPAISAGLEFHAGLVDRIVADVRAEPAALPLLGHTLRQLWERRRHNRLTLPAYEELGGVQQTLAHTADAVIEHLDEDDRRLARRIFLRLTEPGDGTEDTRRAARLSELVTRPGEGPAVHRLVSLLARERLLVTDEHPDGSEPSVDVVHESLLRSWPLLRSWIHECRADLRRQRAITHDARAWRQHDGDESYLYRGSQLEDARALLDDEFATLNLDEQEFVRLSVAVEDERTAAETEIQRRELERDARYRLRGRVLAAAALSVTLLVGLVVFADAQRRRADGNEAEARAAELAATAANKQENERDLALLLSVEATAIDDGPASIGAVLDGLAQPPMPAMLTTDLPGTLTALDEEPATGRLVAATSTGSVVVMDRDGQLDGFPLHEPQSAVAVRWLRDGTILSAGSDGRLLIVQPDGKVVATLRSGGAPLTGLAVQNDGVVTADDQGKVALWRLPGAEPVSEWQTGEGETLVALGPDGTTLVIGTAKGVVFADRNDPTVPLEPLPGAGEPVTALAFDETSNVLAVGDVKGRITQWFPETRSRGGPAMRIPTGAARTLSYIGSGERLMAGSDRPPSVYIWSASAGTLEVSPLWRRPSGEELDQLREQGQTAGDPVNGLLESGDDAIIAGSGTTIVRWSLGTAPGLTVERRSAGGTVVGIGAGTTDADIGTEPGAMIAAGPQGRVVVRGEGSGHVAFEQKKQPGAGFDLGSPISAVAAAGDEPIVAAGSVAGDVLLRADGRWLRSKVEGPVTALSLSADGDLLAVASEVDGPRIELFRRWEDRIERAGELPRSHELVVDSLAFDPDGELLATGSDDRTVRLWAVEELEERQVLRGHTDRVWDLAFVDTGSLLLTGSEDGTVRFWLREGQKYVPLGQPVVTERPVRALSLQADGTVLVGYGDQVVRWQVSVGDWVTIACRFAGRHLSELEVDQYLRGRTARGCR